MRTKIEFAFHKETANNKYTLCCYDLEILYLYWSPLHILDSPVKLATVKIVYALLWGNGCEILVSDVNQHGFNHEDNITDNSYCYCARTKMILSLFKAR